MRPMMPKGVFQDCIHPCTMSFLKPEIEERFRQTQDEKVRGFGISKMVIVGAAAVMTITLCFSLEDHHVNGENQRFWRLVQSLVLGNAALALEFIIHCFPLLRCFRCLPITFGSYFAAMNYTVFMLPRPGMLPG